MRNKSSQMQLSFHIFWHMFIHVITLHANSVHMHWYLLLDTSCMEGDTSARIKPFRIKSPHLSCMLPKEQIIVIQYSVRTETNGGSRISRRGVVDPLGGAWTSNTGTFQQKCMRK